MDVTALHQEIERGRRAETAYDLYIKEHIETVRSQLFNAFCGQDVSDSEVIKMKNFAAAITGLEASVIADIENAKLASKQLMK